MQCFDSSFGQSYCKLSEHLVGVLTYTHLSVKEKLPILTLRPVLNSPQCFILHMCLTGIKHGVLKKSCAMCFHFDKNSNYLTLLLYFKTCFVLQLL